MADISDVETAMVTQIARFLGLGQNYLAGSAVMSPAAGQRCRVYRGWPIAQALDQDLAGGITSLTVFPVAGATRRTTRYLPEWHQGAAITPRLTARVSGATVTFGGYPDVGQVVGVRFGPNFPGQAYAYRLQLGDTIASMTAALAAQIQGATALGASLTLPTDLNVAARLGADQPAWQETRRQMQSIWVVCWSPNPVARDVVSALVDAGFANMTDDYGKLTYFIPLPDGSYGDLRYYSTYSIDKNQTANLWRRDLRYTVDYPTTLLEQQPEVLFTGGTINQPDLDITETFGDT